MNDKQKWSTVLCCWTVRSRTQSPLLVSESGPIAMDTFANDLAGRVLEWSIIQL